MPIVQIHLNLIFQDPLEMKNFWIFFISVDFDKIFINFQKCIFFFLIATFSKLFYASFLFDPILKKVISFLKDDRFYESEVIVYLHGGLIFREKKFA